MVIERMFAEISVGERAAFSKTISESDVYLFAGLCGDFNPLHVDEEFAKKTRFGQRIAHGILTAGLVSTVIGTALPGRNTVYLSQELKFTAPVFFGDTLTAEVTVLEKLETKKILVLDTKVTNQRGQLVLSGQARVLKMEA
jgi:3-hydroxybutyryl-CoA dehydratase